MAGKVFGFGGLLIGFCLWQLWSLKRLEKERERRSRNGDADRQL
ncbi:MAG: hypothetical protein ACRC7G_10120 [Beijerinckiaceae bacterium]